MSETETMPETQATILFVDDEANILSSLKRLFRPFGYRIFTAESGAQGLEVLARESVDLVVSDMRMPEMNGAQFLEKVRENWPETVRILLTGYAEIDSAIAAINKGEIFRYIAKPWSDNNVIQLVQHALERKASEEQIRNLAFYDALTRLPNRRLLNDRMGQMMATSKRNGRYGALMFLDLDNFKPLNDTHGHVLGDLLLIEAARRISCCVREVDTVARFGGDEFVVLLSELKEDKADSTAQAAIVAERIRISLSETYLLTSANDGKADTTVKHHCNASIGVIVFIGHKGSQDNILKWADEAMYQAKEAGRNLIRFYDLKD